MRERSREATAAAEEAVSRIADAVYGAPDRRPWLDGSGRAGETGSLEDAMSAFDAVVDAVEARCMAADGPVTPTLREMREDELALLWRSVQEIRRGMSGMRTGPTDPAPAMVLVGYRNPDRTPGSDMPEFVRADSPDMRHGWARALYVQEVFAQETPRGTPST